MNIERTKPCAPVRRAAGRCRVSCALRLTCALVLSLIVVPAASAQSNQNGPRPGKNDPVRNPILFPAHGAGTFAPGNNQIKLQAWRSDAGLSLSETFSYSQPADADQIVAAAGRIWSPRNEQVVYARRYLGGSQLHVVFLNAPPTNKATHIFNDLAPRLQNSADFMDIAAGDLDKLPDGAGNNHDEIVVAYASPGANNQMTVNVAVLDYTAPASSPPAPVAVSTATASHTINGNNFLVTTPTAGILPVDNVLGVGVGDFDGDGRKEIAAVHIENSKKMWITMFRYTNDGGGNRSLKEVSSVSQDAASSWAATVDVAVGDFDGKGKDELLTGVAEWSAGTGGFNSGVGFNVWQADGNLNMTRKGSRGNLSGPGGRLDDYDARPRVQISAGLFKYDPQQGFDINRRQFVTAYLTGNGLSRRLLLSTYQISDDLSTISPINSVVWNAAAEPVNHQRFSVAAGAYPGNTSGNPPPLWAIAVGAWAGSGDYWLATLNGDLVTATRTLLSNAAVNRAARFPVVPFDLDGKSVYLGAPVHLTADDMITTDYVIQEPPKHAFYDNRPTIGGQPNPNFGKVVNVSRDDDFHVELIDEKKTTLSSKSTDTSAMSVGTSASLTAKETLKAGVAGIGVSFSAEASAKVGYDFGQNKKSYNSNYSERTLSYGGQTNREDYLAGRLQLFDIWRYRIYGVAGATGEPPAEGAGNAFYDLVLPGPALNFQGGASSFDWYQPTHENGNVLSYARPTNNFFTPADLGSYRLPCDDRPDAACAPCDRTSDKACGLYGTRIVREPLIPASRQAWTGNQTFVSLNFTNTATSGRERSTDKTLSENADVKVSVGAKANSLGASVSVEGTFEVEQHGKFSWGHAVTAENASTSGTGITLRTSQGNANQGYPFFPAFYSTADGTIKAAYAVDVLGGSAAQRQFWAALYGGKPDPALNLPGRFQPDGSGSKQQWQPNPLLSRKALRGFFLRHPDPNPVTGEYGYLAEAPLVGDKVRLEARVYNYSTGQAAENLKARFQIVRLDENTYAEVDPRTNRPLADPYLQLDPSLRTTIGKTIVGTMNPLDLKTASIVWDSGLVPPPGAGTMPAGASQSYRVYVVLDPDDEIDEIYDAERPGTFDPGQNNEGYSDIVVMRPAGTPADAGTAQSLDMHLRPDSFAGLDVATRDGNQPEYKTGQVRAFLNRPLRLRVRAHSDLNDREITPMLVYDGDPNGGGEIIAGKFVRGGDPIDGTPVFFEWTPRSAGRHKLYAVLVEESDDSQPGNNTATLEVEVVPGDVTPPRLEVTLTPNRLWPPNNEFVLVNAVVSADDGDGGDPNPQIRLEAITSNEDNDAAPDVEGADFGTDDRSFSLRAKRGGAHPQAERVYTVVYSATDWGGNKTFATAQVIVPRHVRR